MDDLEKLNMQCVVLQNKIKKLQRKAATIEELSHEEHVIFSQLSKLFADLVTLQGEMNIVISKRAGTNSM